jgi:hypothetical protein
MQSGDEKRRRGKMFNGQSPVTEGPMEIEPLQGGGYRVRVIVSDWVTKAVGKADTMGEAIIMLNQAKEEMKNG